MKPIPPCESTVSTFLKNPDDRVARELVAFANTLGGDLYVGVNWDGTVSGVPALERAKAMIISVARDVVYPPIFPLLSFGRLEKNGKTVLVVHVRPGTTPPYQTDPRDTETIFVRSGRTTHKASDAQIRNFMEESCPIPWEERIAATQQLTFEYCQELASRRPPRFDPLLGIPEGLREPKSMCFTNLALLLSDQNPFRFEISVFYDDKKNVLAKTQSVSGSIPLCLALIKDFLLQECLLGISKPRGTVWEHVKHYGIAPEVLDEALLNLVAHRDFLKPSPFTIHVTPSEVMFYAKGGPLNFTEETLPLQIALECRNPRLVGYFASLRYTSDPGLSLNVIKKAFGEETIFQRIQVFPAGFLLSIPRKRSRDYWREISMNELQNPRLDIDGSICRFLRDEGKANRRDLEEALGLPRSTTNYHLKKLLGEGRIRAVGAGKNTVYELPRAKGECEIFSETFEIS